MTLESLISSFSILLMTFAATVGWAYYRTFYSPRQQARGYLPAIVLAPIATIVFFKFFDINIHYPIATLTSSLLDFITFAIIPGCILAIASGLLQRITNETLTIQRSWQRKSFYDFFAGNNLATAPLIRKLAFRYALAKSWQHQLSVLFTELVIVECLFNTPGIGYQLWQQSLKHSFGAVRDALLWFSMLFVVAYACSLWISKQLAQKLKGYD